MHVLRCVYCFKNNIACSELCVGDDLEIIAVEVKGSDPNWTWEVVGIFRAPNEDIRVIERLAARTGFLGTSMKGSSIGDYLNLPQVDLQRLLSEWRIAINVSKTTAIIFTRVGGRFIQPDQ
jgi:hypothetical protein